ncbi:MAG: TfoX/Sxy family protein [Streptosporangiaceae bacterium]|nr:TfoX/Sxy family protein [Streptosporangiaceae bacterium]
MTGHRSVAEHVLDLLGDDSGASLRRFFGGWSIIRDGRQLAIVMDTVYAKVPAPDRERWRAAGSRPFQYQAKGKTVVVEAYWSLPDGALDNPAELRRALLHAGHPTTHPTVI